MSSKNTSPSLRETSIGACIPALILRGEDFGFNAWSATEYDRDTDRSCWSPLSGFMPRSDTIRCEAVQANRWLKCQPSSYVRLEAYGFLGYPRGHRIDPETRCCLQQHTKRLMS